MWSVTPVPHSTEKTFHLCISNMQQDRKKRFEAVRSEIINSSNNFSDFASRWEFHLMPISSEVTVGDESISLAELRSLYDDKLSKEGQPARKIYDDIRVSARNQICPLCGFGNV